MSDEEEDNFPFGEEESEEAAEKMESEEEEREERRTVKGKQRFPCPADGCLAKFTSSYNRKRHFKRLHSAHKPAYDCIICGDIFPSVTTLRLHRSSHKLDTGFIEFDCAFRKNGTDYRLLLPPETLTVDQAFLFAKEKMLSFLNFQLAQRTCMRTTVVYGAEFVRNLLNEDDNLDKFDINFRAPNAAAYNETIVRDYVLNTRKYMNNRVDDFLHHGSGWQLRQLLYIDFELQTMNPLNGSCDLYAVNFVRDIKLPKCVKNMQKKEDSCFLHAIAYYFIRSTKRKKLSRFIEKRLNVKIECPVKITDVARFERHNKHLDIKINVIHYEKEEEKNLFEFYPLYCSKNTSATHEITLVIYKTELNGKLVNHYSCVLDVASLLRATYRNEDGKLCYGRKKLHCLNCFTGFCGSDKEGDLKRHKKLCYQNEPQKIKIPKEGDSIVFKNHVNCFKANYLLFFDFETCHIKPKYKCKKKCDEKSCPHRTTIEAVQKPIIVSYILIDRDEKIIRQRTFTGYDCVDLFLTDLFEIESELVESLSVNAPLKMSQSDEEKFEKATNCHICKKAFLPEDIPVRDHCHITSKYLGEQT